MLWGTAGSSDLESLDDCRYGRPQVIFQNWFGVAIFWEALISLANIIFAGFPKPLTGASEVWLNTPLGQVLASMEIYGSCGAKLPNLVLVCDFESFFAQHQPPHLIHLPTWRCGTSVEVTFPSTTWILRQFRWDVCAQCLQRCWRWLELRCSGTSGPSYWPTAQRTWIYFAGLPWPKMEGKSRETSFILSFYPLPLVDFSCCSWNQICKFHEIHQSPVFPRASERRVLLIVEVCHHIFSSSHLLIFTSSHLLIFTSSHLRIFTSSYLHIFSSSHLHFFTSSHLLIFSSSSSHLLIFSSSHLLHIFCTSSSLTYHIFFTSSSHLHIFSSSHLLIFIFTSSHLHIFTSCPFALLLSCSLALLPSFLSFFSISLLRRGAVPTRRHEMQPFRTKWGSIVKSWRKISIFKCRSQPFARNEIRSAKTDVKLRFSSVPRNPFARNEVRSAKADVELRFSSVGRNRFARNEVRSSKTGCQVVLGRSILCKLCRTK